MTNLFIVLRLVSLLSFCHGINALLEPHSSSSSSSSSPRVKLNFISRLHLKKVAAFTASAAVSFGLTPFPSGATEFTDFVESLGKGEVTKVVFKGVNPDKAYVTYKSGEEKVVSEGFPTADPKTPSGPEQVIALCQHTPGTVCVQDLTELLARVQAKRGLGPTNVKPMLSSSSYPKASELTRLKVNYTPNTLDP